MKKRDLAAWLLSGTMVTFVAAQTPKPAPANDATMQDSTPEKMPDSAAKTFAMKPHVAPKPAVKAAVLTPLSARERVQQVLDRFTFGQTPGQVDRVMALGEDKWIERQMNPAAIKDGVSDKALGQFPTVYMGVPQLLLTFPDRQQIGSVADGKTPYPTDPLLNAVYEVQVHKLMLERDQKKADGSTQVRAELTDEQKAAQKKLDQATASRIAGELFALPKEKRMTALTLMPVEDRIAFTGNGNLPNEQKSELMNDFTPKEREAFTAMSGQVSSSYQIGYELAEARITRDILTDRQLQEVMTDFWFNHFNIYVQKDSDQWYTASYERDVIRKNALGNFKDLLLATAQSPAMMVYLDNWLSIGPDSQANGVDPTKGLTKKGNKGLNENYGREVMELHTVGVNGGYSQSDVTTLAAILTGWGVDRPGQGGGFLFDPKRHEPGPKTWFGYTIDDKGNLLGAEAKPLTPGTTWGPSKDIATPDSVKQGVTALNILAESPKTAHFISYLLAQRFVADDPPPALVDRLASSYMSSKGDIKTVLRALIASPEFNSKQYFHNKVKTPVEFIASAFRSTGTDPQNAGALVNTIRTMGMPLYYALPPTGYYLTADQWMNSSALVDRLNFAYQLTNGKFANQKFDAPRLLAMGLLAPNGMSSTATTPKQISVPIPSAAPKLMGVAAATKNDQPTNPQGTEVALHVLESTMIGAPVSAQTNQLIDKQLEQQPDGSSPTDTLNLLTALVMGSPEFQLR